MYLSLLFYFTVTEGGPRVSHIKETTHRKFIDCWGSPGKISQDVDARKETRESGPTVRWRFNLLEGGDEPLSVGRELSGDIVCRTTFSECVPSTVSPQMFQPREEPPRTFPPSTTPVPI